VTTAATAVGGVELLHKPTDVKGKGREVEVPSLWPEEEVSVVIVSSDASNPHTIANRNTGRTLPGQQMQRRLR